MFACGKSIRSCVIRCLAAVAAVAAVGPAAVRGDGRLSVQATPPVIYSGQSAKVDVLAHFPTPPAPGGAYAFASAEFDMHATEAIWDMQGALVLDVPGIVASQPHLPQTGILADPSNPFHVWSGVLTPQSLAPALVEIAADPINFYVYPSEQTSSSVQVMGQGGNDVIMVNPMPVGNWVAAPAKGTAISVSDDVIVDGRIITGENFDSARVGLYPSGFLDLTDSSARVEFVGQPHTFTVTVLKDSGTGVYGGAGIPTGTVKFILDGSPIAGYVGGAQFVMCDGSVRTLRFAAYIGGVYVASGDLDGAGNADVPNLTVMGLPQTVEAHATGALRNVAGANTYTGTTSVLSGTMRAGNYSDWKTNYGHSGSAGGGDYALWQDNYGVGPSASAPSSPILSASTYGRGIFAIRYDQPVLAVVRGPNGQPQTVTIDFVEVSEAGDAFDRPMTWDNVANKKWSLGTHVFEAAGGSVEHMLITPGQGY